MSLRVRLIAGFVGLLAALGGLGAWSAWRLWDMGAVSARIIAENYDSVVVAQRMKESLERLDSALLFHLAGESARARQQADRNAAVFDAALRTAAGNITEPGEREIVEAIRRQFDVYRTMSSALLAGSPQQARFFAEAAPAFDALRAECDRLLALNQDAMRRKAGEAAAISRNNVVAASGLAVFLLVAGAIVAFVSASAVLTPIEALTRATTEVAAGNLEVRVPVHRSDELGHLARSFNVMAERLREVRASNVGELLQARQLAEAAVDSLYDPVIVTDASGHIVRVNRAAAVLFGHEQDLTGKRVGDVSHDARLASAVEEVLRSQQAVAREGASATMTLATGGADRSYRLRSTPMRDDGGTMLGAVLLLEDVTHLREIDRLKSEFIAAASHELRTPLTSVQMGVHLLLEEPDAFDDRQLDILHMCRDEGERLARLSRDLLDLSRIESGEAPPRLARVPAAAVIRGAVEPVRLQVEAKGIALDVALPPELPPVVADRAQIERVLANLVTNATRATAPGGRISVTAASAPAHVSISVTDTGAGIPAEYLARIFEPFTQVPGVPVGGAGLGLSMSRRIVEQHGGQMTAQSEPGRGSTFTFTLPVVERSHEDSDRR